MKRYCTDCGSPTEYSIKKPLFCSTCGKSFEKTNQLESLIDKNLPQSIKKPVQPKISQSYEIEDDFEDVDDTFGDEITKVPNINKLDVETFIEKAKGEKIEDLIKNPAKASRQPRIKQPKISKKKILEDFKKEAGSIRPSNKK